MTALSQIFEPFSRVTDETRGRESAFYEITHDITKGIALALNLVITSTIDDQSKTAGAECTPLLGAAAREDLMFFVSAAASLLHDRAENEIDHLNSVARKEST